MADTETTNLRLVKPEVGFSDDTWGGKQNAAFDLIDAIFMPGGNGTSVGLHVGTGKVLDARGGTARLTDDRFIIEDQAGGTRNLKFNAGLAAPGVTVVLSTPPASDTIVGIATAQTLTNKTLASPIMTGVPVAPTAVAPHTNDTTVATTAFVTAAIAAAVAAAAVPWYTGDVRLTHRLVADPGWLVMTNETIGKPGSGAAYANVAAQALYELLWTNVADIYAPVTPGGRGSSALNDWNANKALALTKVLGRVLGVAGFGGGGMTLRGLGQTYGEELHALTEAENGPHAHAVPDGIPGGGNIAGGGSYTADLENNGTSSTSGSGTGHNTMQPTTFLMAHIKL